MEKVTCKAKLESISPVKFDKFIDHPKKNAPIRPPVEKLYLTKNNELYLPSENLRSFLFGQKMGAFDFYKLATGKELDILKRAIRSRLTFSPPVILFKNQKTEKPFIIDPQDTYLKQNDNFIIDFTAPMTWKNGQPIKQPAQPRPVLITPYYLEFTMGLFHHNTIKMERIKKLFEDGGIEIGICNHRPEYGRFIIHWGEGTVEK